MDLQVSCQRQELSITEISVWTDVLEQAVTGEMIGALNYEDLSGILATPIERREALDHAEREAAHARMFIDLGESIGVAVKGDVRAPYWSRVRSAFVRRAEDRDRTACYVLQEVMLESFAVASYGRIASMAPPQIAPTFAAIAAEEREHVAHAIELLRDWRAADAQQFDATTRTLHEEVMTVLAEMVARSDSKGHCGLCHGSCVKESLPIVGLCTDDLRGASLREYLQTLDAIGLPGDQTLQWVARLPL
jgi:fatty aldehyde decarbonylase